MTQLKDVYGRRTTPGVKILLLIAIVIFGLCVAATGAATADKKHADKTLVK